MPAISKNNHQDKAVDILIIGGGAAGLMAAGQAASPGLSVCVLEKMERPARKLRITGKGRCNFTNTAGLEDFAAAFDQGGKFLRPCFSRFFNQDLMRFFEAIGVPGRVE
ncbi:MAG: NAD(P)/FAD-dependent oxidoreductase, partial [Thermodesulfobacteriota bacterium]